MFKYPSPWQVLFSGMERRDMISNEEIAKSPYVNDKSHSQTEVPTSNISELHSTDLSLKDKAVGLPEQERNDFENQAVIFPDLPGTHDKETRYECELQVTCTEEKPIWQENTIFSQDINYTSKINEQNTSEPQSIDVPDMDRITRSSIYSLSSARDAESGKEEARQESNSTAQESPSVELRSTSSDVWVPHPDRNNQLRLLKEEKRFDVRAYHSQNNPTKLFTDNDSEDEYSPRSHDLTPEKLLEFDAQRKDIIKRQSQRKSLDMEELKISLDETRSSISGADINGLDSGPNTDQINFEAARQQFLMLEKKKESLPFPSPQLQSKLTHLSSRVLLENDNSNQGKTRGILGKVRDNASPSTENQPISSRSRSSSQRYNNLSGEIYADNVDSRAQEKPQEILSRSYQITEQESEDIPNPSNETPIEREIRLAKEREENLRRERGIQVKTVTNETVEILKNSVLPLTSNVPSQKKSKDRARTSMFLQREIEKEAQREADLKNEGKVAGLYDKGSAQEIDERRKLFEQPDEIPVKPQHVTTKTNFKGTINNYSTEDDITQVYSGEPNVKSNGNIQDVQQPYSVRTNWKPTPMNTYIYRRQSLENILDYKAASEPSQETHILHKENVNVKPQKSHGDEDEKKKQLFNGTEENSNPEVIYNVSRLRPSLSNIIEQEIQKTLERDRDLKAQQRKSEMTSLTSPVDIQTTVPFNGYNQYEKTVLNSGVSNQWSTAPYKANPSYGTPSYILSSEQMFKQKRDPKFAVPESDSDRLRKHGEDSWYAGIDPSDEVNTEIVESTRVNRHKNKMAMRWEAGLYANQSSD
ncbi:mitotic interactor and substrate of PLK1 isoform X1 [Xenopus laevis]|uniref:Mitotic interactor and substrate of PLK1 isoform X1 n=1 Tax=Xenopus laevis TaxID=8355 RepID=A0A8J0U993_XENLA|nr:mitotic interactor and substrate of PLK1 isoform X1 [Xenopus laevis]